MGQVWRDLFKMAGVTLRMSTAFHQQTDSQSEVVNKTLAMYLRYVTGDHPAHGLIGCLGLSIATIPPTIPSCARCPSRWSTGGPLHRCCLIQQAQPAPVDNLLREWDQFLADVRERLLQAQRLSKALL
jgi:hypothetical protein